MYVKIFLCAHSINRASGILHILPLPLQAISYYEAALKSEGQQFLRSDLAELYLKLKQFDKAERTINTALSRSAGIAALHTQLV